MSPAAPSACGSASAASAGSAASACCPLGQAGVVFCHIIVPAPTPAGDPFPGAGSWRGQHVHPGPRPAQAGTHSPYCAAHGPRPGNSRPLHHTGSQLRGGGLRHGGPVGDAGRAQLLDLCSAGSCAGLPAAGQWAHCSTVDSIAWPQRMHEQVVMLCMSVCSRNLAVFQSMLQAWPACGHAVHFALSSHPSSPERHGLCPYPFKRPGLPQVLSGAGMS